jgi:Domain of unknown function (DUF4189)
MTRKPFVTALCTFLMWGGSAVPADLAAGPPPHEESGIWAAIAYSSIDGKHGFFWGADTRREATETALQHCANAGGKSCMPVATFRNHRHWDDDDGTAFPYNHCGALAVEMKAAGQVGNWSAKSAQSARVAEETALKACERGGKSCTIREWVCT